MASFGREILVGDIDGIWISSWESDLNRIAVLGSRAIPSASLALDAQMKRFGVAPWRHKRVVGVLVADNSMNFWGINDQVVNRTALILKPG